MDTLSVMVRRIMRKQSPFAAHRGHIHHILSRIFARTLVAPALLLSAALTLASIGLAGQWFGVPDYAMFYRGLAILVCLVLFQHKAGRVYLAVRRRRRRQRRQRPPHRR